MRLLPPANHCRRRCSPRGLSGPSSPRPFRRRGWKLLAQRLGSREWESASVTLRGKCKAEAVRCHRSSVPHHSRTRPALPGLCCSKQPLPNHHDAGAQSAGAVGPLAPTAVFKWHFRPGFPPVSAGVPLGILHSVSNAVFFFSVTSQLLYPFLISFFASQAQREAAPLPCDLAPDPAPFQLVSPGVHASTA